MNFKNAILKFVERKQFQWFGYLNRMNKNKITTEKAQTDIISDNIMKKTECRNINNKKKDIFINCELSQLYRLKL